MAEDNYDYQETIRRGEAAAQALQSPVLGLAYRMTVDELTNSIFRAEPGHTKTLEELRRQGNALAAVFGKLHQWVAVAESEMVKHQKPDPTAPNEYQGFNLTNVR